MKIRYTEEGRPELFDIINSLSFNNMFKDDGFNAEERNALGAQENGDRWIYDVIGYLDQAQPGENTTDKSNREVIGEGLRTIKDACDTLRIFILDKENSSSSVQDKYSENAWNKALEALDPAALDGIQRRLDAYNEATGYKYMSTPQMRNIYTLLRGMRSVSSKLENIAYMESTGLHNDRMDFEGEMDEFETHFNAMASKAKKNKISLENADTISKDLDEETTRANNDIAKQDNVIAQLKKQLDATANQAENAYKEANAEYLKLHIVELANELQRTQSKSSKITLKLRQDKAEGGLSSKERNELWTQNGTLKEASSKLEASINDMTKQLSECIGTYEMSPEMQDALAKTRGEVSNLKPEELKAKVEAAKAHADQLNVKPGEKFKVVENEHTKALKGLIAQAENLKHLRQNQVEAIKKLKTDSGLSEINRQQDSLNTDYQTIQDNLKTFSEKCDNAKAPAHTKEINARINAFLAKMDKGKRALHHDSDEFTAMKDAMNKYLDGTGSMEDIQKAAADYLEAKKHGMSMGTNMRHIRLTFAKELKAFAEDNLNKDAFVKKTAAEEKQRANENSFTKDFSQMLKDSNTAEPGRARQNIMSSLKDMNEAIMDACADYKKAAQNLERVSGKEKSKDMVKVQDFANPSML